MQGQKRALIVHLLLQDESNHFHFPVLSSQDKTYMEYIYMEWCRQRESACLCLSLDCLQDHSHCIHLHVFLMKGAKHFEQDISGYLVFTFEQWETCGPSSYMSLFIHVIKATYPLPPFLWDTSRKSGHCLQGVIPL